MRLVCLDLTCCRTSFCQSDYVCHFHNQKLQSTRIERALLHYTKVYILYTLNIRRLINLLVPEACIRFLQLLRYLQLFDYLDSKNNHHFKLIYGTTYMYVYSSIYVGTYLWILNFIFIYGSCLSNIFVQLSFFNSLYHFLSGFQIWIITHCNQRKDAIVEFGKCFNIMNGSGNRLFFPTT